MLEIADSGANIHLAIQDNHTMAPVIMDNEMKAILPYGSIMELTHIATLQLPVLSKLSIQIYIYLKIQTASLISLGVLCDDGCTITLDKQSMYTLNNREEIIKGTSKNKTGMWEVPLGPQQSEYVVNKF